MYTSAIKLAYNKRCKRTDAGECRYTLTRICIGNRWVMRLSRQVSNPFVFQPLIPFCPQVMRVMATVCTWDAYHPCPSPDPPKKGSDQAMKLASPHFRASSAHCSIYKLPTETICCGNLRVAARVQQACQASFRAADPPPRSPAL